MPLKSIHAKAEEVAMMFFCWLEVEVKIADTVLRIALEEAKKFPATEISLYPIVRIELVATPS